MWFYVPLITSVWKDYILEMYYNLKIVKSTIGIQWNTTKNQNSLNFTFAETLKENFVPLKDERNIQSLTLHPWAGEDLSLKIDERD